MAKFTTFDQHVLGMTTACVFSIDDAYVMPFQVFFHSLEATSSLPNGIPLFILHTDALSAGSIDRLEEFLGRYGRSASFLDATRLIPEQLPIREGDHVSPATFYRLFIAEILPHYINQAVYLDADMLALGSIASLFSLSVSAMVAAADHCAPVEEHRLWGALGGSYFQAGVLVIPIQAWRKHGLSRTFVEVMQAHQDSIRWWDQDVLNISLSDRWQRIPIWINTSEAVVSAFPAELVRKSAQLIHYSGSRKPWNSLNPSPFTAHWDNAYEATFGVAFNRQALLPPLAHRFKVALRSRLSGLIHGR